MLIIVDAGTCIVNRFSRLISHIENASSIATVSNHGRLLLQPDVEINPEGLEEPPISLESKVS